MKRITLFGILLAVGMLLAGGGARAAENIWPDPSFEATGVAGPAHSGARAGRLQVSERVHWTCIGGDLKVEPFATYRATAWVKANVGKGNPYALYHYAWDSYQWAFYGSVTLKSSNDWQQVSLTFVSPFDHIYFHPLAFIDSENSEAWIDDLVIERVQTPGETMAALIARGPQSRTETQLLARYYLAQKENGKLNALLAQSDNYIRADMAYVMAKEAKDAAKRAKLVAEMVRYGGPLNVNGLDRFRDLTASLSSLERLSICRAALVAPVSTLAVRSCRAILNDCLDLTHSTLTLAETERLIQATAVLMAQARQSLPAEDAARAEVDAMDAQLETARQALAQRRANLGHCVVTIGGKKVTAETYAIVLPETPTLQERHAAQDLQAHLELLTGQEIPLLPEGQLGKRTPIAIGKCKLLKKLGMQIDFKSLGLEGIAIKTAGPALALAGNQRGVLYACYTFLEDYLHCRWFTPDCTVLPKEGTFAIASINRRYLPPLEYRATDYPNSRDGDWAVRNKMNGMQTRLDEERGGHITYKGFVHTFNSLVPPDKYFANHPEYYSEINGKRVGPDQTQLCLTNPEVLRIATETVRRWIQEDPSASIISVSQNDWHNYCQCPRCSALAAKEGSQAGPLLHFVNAIADAIKTDYPDKIIDTLAYQYTRKPPKFVRPHSNVAVRLCSIECCFSHPLASDPANKSFVEDIRGWSKSCKRLHIWDYVINYAHCILPFPNLYVLKPNINFFINNGVTGIYEEANYFSKGGELAELRTYIMAKTLWDPSYDTDKAIDEFLAGYYGPAARPIREYINLVHRQVQENPELHVRIYSPPTAGYLTPRVMQRAVALFDEAERAVADQPALLHRVQVARLPILYAQIALRQSGYQEAGDRLAAPAGGSLSTLVNRFATIANEEGVTHVREGGLLQDWLNKQPRDDASLRIIRLRNPQLEVSLLPERGGRIWRLRYLPGNQDLLKIYGAADALQPEEGGYEEYSTSEYRSPGWSEKYTVTEESQQAASFTAQLPNGLKITRRIALDPQKAEIQIQTTVTNTREIEVTAGLRVHPSFAVSDTQKTSVWLRQANGAWQQQSLAAKQDAQAERERWLRDADRPAGAWAVVDETTGLGIVDRFDPAQIKTCYINWNGKDKRTNLELFAPSVQLKAGESQTLAHTYEILPNAAATLGK